jgi:hypothetical protein
VHQVSSWWETAVRCTGSVKVVVSPALERDIALQKLSEADATARQTRIAIAETVQRIRMLE